MYGHPVTFGFDLGASSDEAFFSSVNENVDNDSSSKGGNIMEDDI